MNDITDELEFCIFWQYECFYVRFDIVENRRWATIDPAGFAGVPYG